MHRTDDDTLNAALQLLGDDTPPQPPNDHIDEPADPATSPRVRRRLPIPAAVAAVSVLLALGVAVLINQPDSGASAAPSSPNTPTTPGTTTPPVGAITVEGELLGSIRGTLVEDNLAVAYPGQPVTAPRPRRGHAVAWQWELCNPRCSPIGGATHETQASPPTPSPVNVRVVVQVDLDGAQIRIASAPYRAMPWPDETATTVSTAATASTELPALVIPTPSTTEMAPSSSAATSRATAAPAPTTIPA
jgi:hypothetical protein